MAEFWNMGGYAVYIWPSYGLAALIVLGLTVFSLMRHARVKAELERLEARGATRRRAKAD